MLWFLIILAVIVLGGILIYNSLIALRNHVKEAWSDIQVQMKRRYDLIPNLINTVKGYAQHEDKVLEQVTQARTAAMASSGSPKEQAEAENQLKSALKSLFAVSENYPDLKANQNFLHLQQELVDSEDKIQAARRFYNTNVMKLNTKIEVFPANLLAKSFNFKKEEFFEIDESKLAEVSEPVKVEFDK
ncbi:hypothetical protein COT40_00590 [Candidatus Peregrinibacteria bacterium CG08_land_8_20_14_0_20_41_10]|nr:MAG: hypothetical protein COT40_00590 [Candidatus Peregrinibacteria bacterium CG08_land_8_20_14_0_20_41_10]